MKDSLFLLSQLLCLDLDIFESCLVLSLHTLCILQCSFSFLMLLCRKLWRTQCAQKSNNTYSLLIYMWDSFTLLKASTSWARVLSLRAVLVILSLSLSNSSLSLSKASRSCATAISFCFSSAVRSFRSACSYNSNREIKFLGSGSSSLFKPVNRILKKQRTFYQNVYFCNDIWYILFKLYSSW